MAKPKAIGWLEGETGQTIDYEPKSSPSRDRHISVRVDARMSTALDELAAERRLTVSQLVRELLGDAVAEHEAVRDLDAQSLVDRLTADVAEVRRRLAS